MAKTRLVAKLQVDENVFVKSTEQNTLLKEESIICQIRNGPRVLFLKKPRGSLERWHAKGYGPIWTADHTMND